MSLLSTRETICQKLSEQFDSITQPATSAASATKREIADVTSQLRAMAFSPEATIDQAISDLNDDVQEVIPEGNPDDVQEAIDFINNCPYLAGDDLLSNPIALFNGAVDSTVDATRQLVSNVAEALPEFNAAQIISDIQERLTGALEGLPSLPDALDITAIVQAADQIINCISGRCGSGYNERVAEMTTQLQSIYDDFSLVDNPISEQWGKLDLDQIYSDAELEVTEIAQMNKVVASVDTSKSDALNGISNINGAFKSAATTISGIF